MQTVELIPSQEVWQRNSTLQMIAMELAEHREFAGAKRVLGLIPSNVDLAAAILAKNDRVEQLSPQEQSVVDAAMIKSTGLIVVAQNQAESGDVKAALKTASSISLEGSRDVALWRVISIAADSGHVDAVQESFDEIRGEEDKERALVRIVAALAKQGEFERAADLVESIKGTTQRAAALVGIAAAYAARGDVKVARMFFDKAKALTPSDDDAHDVAAKRLGAACVESHQLELAETFAGEINNSKLLSESLQTIAVAKSRMKMMADARRLFERSRQVATSISNAYYKCVRLRELAAVHFETGDRAGALSSINLAVESAQKIEIGGGTDVIALSETATTQFTIGDRVGSASTYELARAAATRYPDEPYVAQLLQGVASAQASVGDVDAAIASARAQDSALVRSRMLLSVANAILSRRDVQP